MSSKNTERISFASRKNQLEYPDFLDIQLKSFSEFFQLETTPENRKKEGLFKVFTENFPITDTRNNFVLEFLDYFIDPPRYTIEECIERGLTFSVPLKAKLKLYCTDPEHEDFDTVIQDVYLGTIPYMTDRGNICNQWCRTGCCITAPPFTGCILRTEHSCQRYQTLFSKNHSFQRFLDGICYRHQQCDVCLYRP